MSIFCTSKKGAKIDISLWGFARGRPAGRAGSNRFFTNISQEHATRATSGIADSKLSFLTRALWGAFSSMRVYGAPCHWATKLKSRVDVVNVTYVFDICTTRIIR